MGGRLAKIREVEELSLKSFQKGLRTLINCRLVRVRSFNDEWKVEKTLTNSELRVASSE
jgi:hypothetical protein